MDENPGDGRESREARRASIDHDDTCSSEDTNMKATQLSPSDLPSSEAAVQSIGEDDFTCPSPAKRYTISVEESVTRNLPCYTPGQGVGNVTGVAPQPLSTSPNPSIRHKYLIESTLTTSPVRFTSIGSQEDELSPSEVRGIEPECITTSYYHRNTAGGFGFESVLSEIHNRCKTNDNINQDLEQKLETKNRQLSENHALLEQSRETISDLRNNLSVERKEKLELQDRMKDLEKDWKEFAVTKNEMDQVVRGLKGELWKAGTELSHKELIIESLSQNLKKANSDQEMEVRSLRSTLDQITQEKSLITDQLESQNRNIEDHANEIDALKQKLSAKQDDLISVTSQLTKEEKLRKHAVKEHELVTMQGQTLMQQQMAIRSQYQEDIEELQTQLHKHEAALQEKEQQLQQIRHKAKSSDENVSLLSDKNNHLSEQLSSEQHRHHLQEKEYQSQLFEQEEKLAEMIDKERTMQQTISTLADQQREFEDCFTADKRQLASDNASLQAEIDQLKEALKSDHKTWVDKEARLSSAQQQQKEEHAKALGSYQQIVEKESVKLKCTIAELEEKLDQRNTVMSKLKDRIIELTNQEDQTTSAYNDLQEEMKQLEHSSKKNLEEKEERLNKLTASIANLEKDSRHTMADHEKTITELNKKLATALEAKQTLQDTCTDLREHLEEARKVSEQFQSMRALVSRKESSKRILVAEQQRIGKEFSSALSEKMSEVNNLEAVIRQLQQENTTLKKEKDSAQPSTQSMDTNIQEKLAKRQSSNLILAAENQKLKTDLKTTETWWQRDINELQKRCATQHSRMSQMERKLTGLEWENAHLKQRSEDTFGPAAVYNFRPSVVSSTKELKQPNAPYDNLLDHYKQELAQKDATIKSLETALQAALTDATAALRLIESATAEELAIKEGLEEKLNQNEADIENVRRNLVEAERAIDRQDEKALQNLVHKSTTQIDLLMENLVRANRTTSITLEQSTEKQSSLIRLHQKFSQTLAQIQKDTTVTSMQHRHQFEELHAYFENQVQRVEDTLKAMLQARGDEIADIRDKNIQLVSSLSEAKEEAKKQQHDIEQEKAKNRMLKNVLALNEKQTAELEQTAEQLREELQEQTNKLNFAAMNAAVEKDRSLLKIKNKYEQTLGKEAESHAKELQSVREQLQKAEKDNTTLQEQINRLQSKLFEGSKELEVEVQDLHSKLHTVSVERSAMQDRFKESLESLKVDNELLMKEKNQQIHRQNCLIAELEAKYKATKVECTRSNSVQVELQKSLHDQSAKHLTKIDQLNAQLQKQAQKMQELAEGASLDKRQLTQTLDDLTKREIECVKLSNDKQRIQEDAHNREKHYEDEIRKLNSDVKNKAAQLKQANNNIRQMREAIKSSENELELAEERLQLIKKDLKHVESISSLYKNEIDNMKINPEVRLVKADRPHAYGIEKSKAYHSPIIIQESTDGLGCKVAELANELTARNKQMELQDVKLKEYTERNAHLLDSIRALSKQKDDLEIMFHNSRQQVEKLQQQLKQRLSEHGLLKEEYDKSGSTIESLKHQIKDKTHENEVLAKRISNAEQLHVAISKDRRRSEDLMRTAGHLRHKMESERELSAKTEQRLRDQSSSLSREVSVLHTQLDDAFQRNQSLDRYIQHLRRSYGQLFEDTEQPTLTYSRKGSGYYDASNQRKK